MTDTLPRTRGTARGIALSTLIAGIIASILNAVVAIVALMLGADSAVQGLTPGAYVTFTIVGVLIGAIGWALIRRTRSAKRVLSVLVPVVLVLSLIPDVALAAAGGSAALIAGIALGVMHVVTVAVAVPVYRAFLPLPAAVS